MRSHTQQPPNHDTHAEDQHANATPHVTGHDLLRLQRTIGNQAVMRMLGKGWAPARLMAPPPPRLLTPSGNQLAIQREWVKKKLPIDDETVEGYWNQERRPSKAEFYAPDESGQFGMLYKYDSDSKSWYIAGSLYGGEHTTKMEEILGKQEVVVPKEPEPEVQLPAKAITHIFEGEANSGGDGHVGLHSKAKLGTKATTFDVIHDPDGRGVYSAIVKLKGYTKEKGSFFFPDDWSDSKIVREIAYAWKRKMVPRGGGAVHWYGESSDGLLIGGLGGTRSVDDLITAFPAYDGEFLHPDTISR